MNVRKLCLAMTCLLLGCDGRSFAQESASASAGSTGPQSPPPAAATAPVVTPATPPPAAAVTNAFNASAAVNATNVAPGDAAAKAVPGVAGDKTIRFQFDGLPYSEVVTRFAQMANKPLMGESRLEGTLTFNDPQPYTYAEALDTLNLILSMKGVMLVESDRYLRLVPFKEIPQMPIRIFRGLERTGDVPPGEVVTVVLSLKNLDSSEVAQSVTAMLSSAGSIAPLSRGRGLIVTDRLANIKRVRELLAEIDTASPVQRQMKSYNLLHASGAVLTDLINKTFGVATAPRRVEFNQQTKQYQQLPADPNDYITAVFDQASQTLVLFGPADRIALAESLIQRFEDKSGVQAGEVRIFLPQSTSAQDLARMIRQAVPGVAEERENAASAATKARLIVDPAGNRLIVTAPMGGQLDEIEKLVKKIDVPAEKGAEPGRFQDVPTTKIFRCRSADPNSIVRILGDALGRSGPRNRGETPFRVTLDPKTKSIVLTGTPADIANAMDIVRQLDTEETVPRAVRIYAVKTGRATDLSSRVQQLYNDQVKNLGDNKSPEALILPDVFGSRLILAGTEAQLGLISSLLAQLDLPAEISARQLKALTLKYTSANSIAAMIGQLYGRQFRTEDPLQRVVATASNDDKTLMLEATAAMLAKIEETIRTLDVAPESGAFEVRTYHLTEANANELSQNLARLFTERQEGRRRNPAAVQPRFEADSTSNTLMVAATPEQFAQIERLIKELKASAEIAMEIRTFPLKYVDPEQMVQLLDTMLRDTGVAGQNRRYRSFSWGNYGPVVDSGKVRIAAAPALNAVVVQGPPDKLRLAEQLLATLDKEQTEPSSVIRTVQLKKARVESITEAVNRAVASRGSRNQPPRTHVTPVSASNTLLIDGPPSEVQEVLKIIQELDQESTGGNIEFHIYRLEHGNAQEVSRVLGRMLDSLTRSLSQFGRSSERIPVTVAVEDRSNSLIVSATPESFKIIEKLVTSLDQAPRRADRIMTLFSLANADAYELASRLESLYADRPKADRVVAEGDFYSNSLTVLCRPQDLPDIEEIIRRLDAAAIDSSLQVRMIALDKIPATQMANMLRNIYAQMYAGDVRVVDKLPQRPAAEAAAPRAQRISLEETNAAAPSLQAPTNAPSSGSQTNLPEVAIAIDKTANALLVSGPAHELDRIQSIVRDLTRTLASNDTELRMFALKEADPTAVARTLNDLFRQDQPRFDPNSQQFRNAGGGVRRPNQTGQPPILIPPTRVIVVAEPRTRSIIVRAQPTDFTLVESLIKQLDVAGVSLAANVRIFPLESADAISIQRILGSLFSGANAGRIRPEDRPNVAVDERLNALIVSGNESSFGVVTNLIDKLDREGVSFSEPIRVVPLQFATAQTLSASLSVLFNRRYQNARSPEMQRNRPIILPDPRGNNLLIAATADDNRVVDELLQQLDRQPENPAVSIDILSLRYGDATRVAPVLAGVFEARRQSASATGQPPAPRDQVFIQAETRNNALIVSASPENFELLKGLLEKLDAEPKVNLRVFPLRSADATTLQRVLMSLYSGPAAARLRPEDRPNVAVEERINALIVSGGETAFGTVTNLIEQLDKEGVAFSEPIRLVPLKFATAQTLSSALVTLFNQRYQSARSPELQRKRPVIIPDPRSNSLLVAANADDNRALDELLAKLDRKPENEAVSVTVLGLRHNDSARVAPMLTGVFEARRQSSTAPGQPPAPRDQVYVQADSLNNALIVSASTENLEVIRGLLEKIDVEPVAAEGLIQTFPLKQADAQRVVTMLRSLMDQGVYRPGATGGGGGRRGGGRDALAVTVDTRSNTLIVSASPENLMVVKELIRQLDAQAYADSGDIRLFTLKHAKASQLASVLEQFFRSKRASEAVGGSTERSVPVTVTPDDRTDTLLVTGGKDTFAAIERMIAQLDSVQSAERTSFRVIPLRQATAAKLQATLTQLFMRRNPTVRGQAPDPIAVVADSWANALIVGASPEDLTMVESLIKQLDNDTTEPGVEVQVMMLAKADVRRVAQTLQGLYRTGGPGSTSPVTINTDERLNALVVSAGQADIKRIAELVKKLDTDQVAQVSEIRIFPLRNARATQLASILTSLLNSKPTPLTDQSPSRQSLLQFIARSEEGKELLTSALREAVQITPDPRSNALLIAAPVDYMQLLTLLIERLDTNMPAMAQIKVFNLKNADARQMSVVLSSLFRLQRTTGQGAAADRSIQYSLVRPEEVVSGEGASAVLGTAEENTLTVTVDLRTNSLLVGGSEHYVALATEIIESLDSSPAQERKSEVYRLKNSRSWEIETALRNFLKRDTQLISAVAGTMAMAQELLEREVGIVAETNSNTLLISATPRYFDQVKALIAELDQPQRQVLIQVLLAEVTLDKNRDLGVEWTYQSGGNPTSTTGTDFGVADALKNYGGFSSAVSGDHFNVLFRALDSEGRLQVLSRPQILTADNQEATIKVGQQVPVVTDSRVTQYGDSINSFQYKDVGVNLTVTPRISPDGFVKMDVGPQISQLSSSSVEVSKGFTVPIINQRSAKTTVSVQSGQSILIGGLISSTDDVRTKRTPFLGRIPLLGALFRNSTKASTRVELLVMLTPQVLVKSADSGTTRDAKEVTREQLDKSSIQKEFTSDPLQRQMLEPLYPNLPKKEPASTKGDNSKKP